VTSDLIGNGQTAQNGYEAAAVQGAGPPETPLLTIEGICKSFPGVQALGDVSLVIAPGQVHAIVGENGAGKSTLVQVISGAISPDSGRLLFDGDELHGLSRQEATRLGIRPVYQQDVMAENLSVAECMFFGKQPKRSFGRINWLQMNQWAASALEPFHADIRPSAKVGSLSLAQREIASMASAITGSLRLLILDEPTSLLTRSDTERLFEIIRRLTQKGVAVLYITHRLAEVFEIADRVTVLKDGRVSGSRPIAKVSPAELIRLMVGRDLSFERKPGSTSTDGIPVLDVRNLCSSPRVHDVSFDVRRGEIVCLAGLVGAGRTETCEAIFGARPRNGGSVWINGTPSDHHSPAEAIERGMAMVPEDRLQSGLIPRMTIVQNLAVCNLDQLSKLGLVVNSRARRLAETYIRELRISPPDPSRRVAELSGGNQQKVLLAKWLARKPELLIIDEPTRGVDVGAREDLHRILRESASQGAAILVVSSDLPEVLSLADRIIVIREGRNVGMLNGADATEEEVICLASGEPYNVQGAA
jgi:ABC-type sugar transport system ATPase subunit